MARRNANAGKAPGAPKVRSGAALRIATLYLVFAGIWIIGSDQLLGWLFPWPEELTRLQTAKGWFFIIVTACLLYTVLRRRFRADTRRIAESEAQGRRLDVLVQFHQSILDNASIWICVLDPAARMTVWNKAAERISGFSHEEVLGSSDIWQWLYPDAAYRARIHAKLGEILNDGLELDNFETTIRCRDGGRKTISWHTRRYLDQNGAMGAIAIGLDRTRSKQAERALRGREQQLAMLMANVPGMVYRCSDGPDMDMLFVSNGSVALTGYAPEALVGSREVAWHELVHPDDRSSMQHGVRASVQGGHALAIEYRIVHRNGNVVWVWEQSRAWRSGERGYREGIIINISDRKQMEQQLEKLAVQDPLTGLLNRRQLAAVLDQQMNLAARDARTLALLWIDIDRFKAINDQLGHLAGDEVLRQISQLVRDNIRSVDFATRFGGDELVVVLPGMDADDAMVMAQRLQTLLQAVPVPRLGGEPNRVTVSIGVAAYPEHGSGAEALMAAADDAMYVGKRAGRNRVIRAATPGA